MREIPLTQGKFAIVDEEDYPELSKYRWRIQAHRYAAREGMGGDKRKQVYMHRELLGVPEGFVVDHINGDPLDNRKSNLRICRQADNAKNQTKTRSDNSSGYKGVTFWKRDGNWKAQLYTNGKNINLGYFDNKHDAARMYNFWARDMFGDFASLNTIVTETKRKGSDL